jgi:predicted nucleic acid-binding protein
MKIVDCTVLADFYVGEELAKKASHGLLREDPDWISVGLWRYEFGNVLLKYVRVGRLAALEMELALQAAPDLLVEVVEEIDSLQVWRLSLEKGLSYHDAAYVWLARSCNTCLYTRDGGIMKKCPEDSAPLPGLE